MRREIGEQPAVIEALVARHASTARAVHALLPIRPPGVIIVARGSSDAVASYLSYAIEVHTGIPVSLASPSVMTRYGASLAVDGWLAIAISQSGETPEIVTVAQSLLDSGARLVSITNGATSSLAAVSDLVIRLDAGIEQAVPATKTVTAQLVAGLAIVSGLGGGIDAAQLRPLVAAITREIDEPFRDGELVAQCRSRHRLLVIGRGLASAAAREIGLKVRETTGISAEAWSSADLRHGPQASLDVHDVLLVIDPVGFVDDDADHIVERARLVGAYIERWTTPDHLDGLSAPIVHVVRGQRLAYELTTAMGRNPDLPAGLSKITTTV